MKAPKRKPKPKPTARNDEVALRSLVTPEGVDLRLRLGTVSERMGALLLDLAIMAAALIAASILALLTLVAAKGKGGEALVIIWLTAAFFLRNLYFVAFELGPWAATPGKRASRLRVAARSGERLTANAVIARNAMRELELFLPITLLFTVGRDVEAWVGLAALVWAAVFVLFPLFNRDRLRVGDLVAGTWVVKAPRQKLLPDLARMAAAPAFAFSREQLDAYGIKELHVLEEVLRRSDRKTMALVATRIRDKIGWPARDTESDADFLGAYYAGLRGRLEQGLLLGKRRKDKFDRG